MQLLRDVTANCNYANYCKKNNLPIILIRSVNQMTYFTIGKAPGLQLELSEFSSEQQTRILIEIINKGTYLFPNDPWDIILNIKTEKEVIEILSERYDKDIIIDDIRNLSIWDLQVICVAIGLNYKTIGI